jgi:hypothetical protein
MSPSPLSTLVCGTMGFKFLLTFFRIIFWVACVAFAINRVKTCFDIYEEDASYSNTEYRDFLSPHSPYPAITICVKEPYVADEMKKFNISNLQYANPEFMEFRNLTYLNSIPYDKITLNPKEKNFELKTIIYLKNKDVSYYKFNPVADPNLRGKYFKCFTCDITQVPSKINRLQVKMKVKGWHTNSLEIANYLHLPGLFRGARRYEITTQSIKNTNYKIIVDAVEVSKLRSTTKTPCDTNIREYDHLLIQDILASVGCKPYYLQEETFAEYPNCTTVEQITQLNGNLDIKNTFSVFKQFR